jgi:NAD(P) transhydrogenase subunit alpha
MKLGIPKEVHPDDRRVAITPETVKRLNKLGFEEILVEKGAGEKASFPDSAYEAVGCEIAPDARTVWSSADIILKVREPMQVGGPLGQHEADLLREGQTLISYIWPAQNEDLVKRLAKRKGNVFAMDAIPRITRAQKCDALSSMSNIAGYRAVIEGANHFGSFFTAQMTAAGKVPPATVLVIGAGVAGLAAIGAARGLGAIVKAFDARPVVKEQIESMGAEYLTVEIEEDGSGEGGYAKTMSKEFIEAEHKLFEDLAPTTDIVVTTALIPGKPAPLLYTEQAVKNMKPGSVIVDLAAERGGNCPLAEANKVVTKHDVTIVGYTDLASRMPNVASNLYGNNLYHVLDEMGGNEGFDLDESNEIIRGSMILREGEMKWPPPKIEPPPAKKAEPKPEPKPEPVEAAKPKKADKEGSSPLPMILAGLALMGIGWTGSDDFLSHFTVFVLACFVGWQVIWNVSAALHTPLMSVTNAISGIIIVGGMLQMGGMLSEPATILGVVAIVVATINIAGGFLVTQRMLKMFQR